MKRMVKRIFLTLFMLGIPVLAMATTAELVKAIQENDLSEVKRLSSKKKYLNVFWEDEAGNKRTPLMVAAKAGNADMVRLLLEKGADPGKVPTEGSTALILASNGGYTPVVELLINKGADVNAGNQFGATPLINAVTKGHLEIVKLLLENKADTAAKFQPPHVSEGVTALQIAEYKGYKEMVTLITLAAEGGVCDERSAQTHSLMQEGDGRNADIHGELLEKSEEAIRVISLGLDYTFPIEKQTKILDEAGGAISVTDLVIGQSVGVAISDDKVMEIVKGGSQAPTPSTPVPDPLD